MNTNTGAERKAHRKVIEVNIHGRRGLEEYCTFAPEMPTLVGEAEKIRILVIMHDFDGWDAGSLWETTDWNAKRFEHIERAAVIGKEDWQKCAMGFSKPFTNAKTRYFTIDQLDAARAWVNESP